MTYENLIIECENNNIIVIEKNFKSDAKGLCKGNKIGISLRLSTDKEKSCILSEELGHYYTTYGNILDQNKVENRKQELRARRWAYEKLINFNSLIEASNKGIKGKYNLSEFLNVTEEFLEEALAYYKIKYGIYKKVDNYIIYFEPLGILKVF